MILAVGGQGVGSLTGVRGFSRAFHDMLLSQARTLMAADLSLRVFELPTPQQTAEMDALAKIRASTGPGSPKHRDHGLRRPVQSAPMLVSVKAVDPRKYPFYGEIRLNRLPLRFRKRADRGHRGRFRRACCCALNLKVGDTIRFQADNRSGIRKGQVTYGSRIVCSAPSTWDRA